MRQRRAKTIEPLLTVTEVAEICRVSERTVRRWIADGTLRSTHLGRVVRIRRRDLEDFIREGNSHVI